MSEQPAVTQAVPFGNHERMVQCSCGHVIVVPINVLTVTCSKCCGTLAGFSSLGVQQR